MHTVTEDAPRVYPVLGLVLGIISLAGCLFGIVPLMAGVVGIVLSTKASRMQAHRPVALAGLVVSALGVAAGAGVLLTATLAVLSLQ